MDPDASTTKAAGIATGFLGRSRITCRLEHLLLFMGSPWCPERLLQFLSRSLESSGLVQLLNSLTLPTFTILYCSPALKLSHDLLGNLAQSDDFLRFTLRFYFTSNLVSYRSAPWPRLLSTLVPSMASFPSGPPAYSGQQPPPSPQSPHRSYR